MPLVFLVCTRKVTFAPLFQVLLVVMEVMEKVELFVVGLLVGLTVGIMVALTVAVGAMVLMELAVLLAEPLGCAVCTTGVAVAGL